MTCGRPWASRLCRVSGVMPICCAQAMICWNEKAEPTCSGETGALGPVPIQDCMAAEAGILDFFEDGRDAFLVTLPDREHLLQDGVDDRRLSLLSAAEHALQDLAEKSAHVSVPP